MTARRRALRLGQYVLVLWVAVTLNFALPRLAPGDPLELATGFDMAAMSAVQRAQLAAETGLDAPLAVQYARYLAGMARGDLGRSFRYGAPVTSILRERLVWTLALVVPTLLLSLAIGTILGAGAAWRRQRASDMPLLSVMLAVDSVPPFWFAMVLIAIFAGWLGWLPSFAAMSASSATGPLDLAWDLGRRLLLPVATLTLVNVPHVFLVARASLVTTLGEDFMVLAEAKGLSERATLFRHALPNALLPIYTNAALSLGALAGGAVLIETAFGYPGLGRLMIEAVGMRDYPLLQGALLLVTVGVVAGNAIADLTYPFVDPRVRMRV
jgi:peptide/nickel transport system permease protein